MYLPLKYFILYYTVFIVYSIKTSYLEICFNQRQLQQI